MQRPQTQRADTQRPKEWRAENREGGARGTGRGSVKTALKMARQRRFLVIMYPDRKEPLGHHVAVLRKRRTARQPRKLERPDGIEDRSQAVVDGNRGCNRRAEPKATQGNFQHSTLVFGNPKPRERRLDRRVIHSERTQKASIRGPIPIASEGQPEHRT